MEETIASILKRHPDARRDSLIPILQEVQEAEGYISKDALAAISRHLNLPSSKIYGVATFYNMFRFQPRGKYHIMCCRGTACHVKGSGKVLDTIVKTLKIEPGQTTKDKLFSLEVVACMGACALSPALCINEVFYAKVSPAKITQLIEECREKAAEPAQAAAQG